MKFSELSGRKKRENVSSGRTDVPVRDIDLPKNPAAAKITVESAESASDQVAGPAPVLSRRERQRKDDASIRENEKPFREMDESAKELYGKNLAMVRELFGQIDRPYVEKYDRIIRLADVNARMLGENPVLLNYITYSTADNYIYAHSVNVAILSQTMGLALALDAGLVNFLGFCAMAHDIGMAGRTALANKAERLTDEEFAEVTRHSGDGARSLERIIDIDHKLKDRAEKVVYQVHERIDASGYPERLNEGGIDILAQIIGIADVYEAMSHPRAWREAYHPHTAMKHLIDKEGHGFNSKIVKALMVSLSLYPPGSLVMLSSGEIARVIKINKGSLTRPVVEILLSANFDTVPTQTVDLVEHPFTAIERVVEFEEISRRNHKFAALLELGRWWVDW